MLGEKASYNHPHLGKSEVVRQWQNRESIFVFFQVGCDFLFYMTCRIILLLIGSYIK
jgi:hypothetical protein